MMSKVYVIKNKEGEYYTDVIPVNEIIFTELVENAWQFNKEQDAKDEIEYRKMKDCTIVPITICEGDLEEKYEVLKGVIHLAMDYACKDKKLYKRIQDFNVSTNRHNGDNNVYLEDAVCFLTKLSKDARDDAKKWGEFFEKVYQEQQAKESEK